MPLFRLISAQRALWLVTAANGLLQGTARTHRAAMEAHAMTSHDSPPHLAGVAWAGQHHRVHRPSRDGESCRGWG